MGGYSKDDHQQEVPGLNFTEKLVGKDTGYQKMTGAINFFLEEGPTCVQVMGDAGVGKTYFVRSVFKDYDDFLIFTAYFDARNGRGPYAIFNELLTTLIEKLEERLEDNFEKWIQGLEEAFGWIDPSLLRNVRILHKYLDVARTSESKYIQPSVKRKQIDDLYRDVILYVLQSFNLPLVLIFEETHMADKQSLNLLYEVFKSLNGQRLFVLVGRGALDLPELMIGGEDEEEERSSPRISIKLSSLNRTQVEEFIQDSFEEKVLESGGLAEIVHSYSRGNVFEVCEFLTGLVNSKELCFSNETKQWQWSKDTLDTFERTDWIQVRKAQLTPEQQELLNFISCFGTHINVLLVASLGNFSISFLHDAFGSLVSQGFLEPEGKRLSGDAEVMNYRFTHFETQDVVYQELEESEKVKNHRKIAFYYIKNSVLGVNDRDLFEAVRQLNQSKGIPFSEEEERLHAELNLRAAKKARQMASYDLGMTYIEEILPFGWLQGERNDQKIFAEAILEGYQLARLCHNKTLADQWFKIGDGKLHREDLFKLRLAKVILDVQFGELKSSLGTGLVALRDLGVRIPKKGNLVLVLKEVLRTRMMLSGKTEDDIYNLPPIQNEKIESAFQMIFWLFRCTQYLDPELNGILALRQLQLMLRYGTNGDAYSGLMAYGVIIGSGMNDYNSAFLYSDVGRRIAEKYNNHSGKVDFGRAIYWPFKHSLADSLPFYEMAIHKEQANGDFVAVAEAMVNQTLVRLSIGENLHELKTKITSNLDYCQGVSALDFRDFHQMVLLNLKQLMNVSLSGEEREVLTNICNQTQFRLTSSVHGILQMKSNCLQGDWDAVVMWADNIKKKIDHLTGLYFKTEYDFYASLGWMMRNNKGTLKPSEKRKVKKVIDKLTKWTAASPDNYLHKLFIVQGVQSICTGNPEEGIGYLDKAMRLLKEQNIHHLIGLVKGLQAEAYQRIGDDKKSQSCKEISRDAYKAWGRDVKELELV